MYFEAYKIARIGEWAKRPLFRGGVRALGGDRAFHQQDEKGECDPNHGEDKPPSLRSNARRPTAAPRSWGGI